MKHRHSHLLIGYWGGLHAAGQRPEEGAFDEAIISSLAPHLFILEMEQGANARYRLAGSAIEHAFGLHLQGTDFLDHWAESDRDLVKDFSVLAVHSRRPLCLLSFCDYEKIEFETVLVPVTAADVRRKRIIGVSMALGDEPPKPAPRRRIQHLTHIGFAHDALTAKSDRSLRRRA
ncbi:MAG: hypothetical protein JWP16_1888 [Alphaproteobacteria bacterium]|nr:hypothetical protein [Alphaproteobacteria bacterium]MDB5740848.1 hypothetical protein [Alphaproteobacteria bacterium]